MSKVRGAVSRFSEQLGPVRVLVLGYLLYAIVGWAMLSLPISHRVGAEPTSIDTLFTSVSGLSTTGLSTVDTGATYSMFGLVVLLLLIQAGGLGYMTLGSFIVLSRSSELPKVRAGVGALSFPMPSHFTFSSLLRTIVVYTAVVETIGAGALWYRFDRAGIDHPLWNGIFHSVSSFCTAGFALFPDSLEGFVSDFWVNAIVSVLSLAGAIGFIVAADWWGWVSGRQRSMTITSRIIVFGTMGITIFGALVLMTTDPIISSMPGPDRMLASWFQSMTASTTVGFNTVPIGAMAHSTSVLMLVLMVIGASPSGTGGGLKTTTVSAMLGQAHAALKGSERVTFWRREIPVARLRAASAASTCYLITLAVGVFLLSLTSPQRLEDIIYEASSALGTVGLSRGITSDLTELGRLVVILLMFVGRVGPLTIGAAMFLYAPPSDRDLAV